MPEQPKTVLYYTFGNHGHWVDMEWLWGYDAMPSSIVDMLHFCNQTGAKGNLNFDAVGYEKWAAANPEMVASMRQMLADGTMEIASGSYGQPYGLFHGGESNIRQRVYGVRTCTRVLGSRPRTFWEEEFDFFPQLPQILRGVGIEYASLFFQWTWHTPEVPYEDVPAVWWEAPDGSRLLTATRNKLNVHQWPEDLDIVLNDLRENAATHVGDVPPLLLLQWLELMPTPDWMCRSEVLLPKTLELLADPRFEFRHTTLSGYLSTVRDQVTEVRRYGMDDVWHGMSLGKNGDLFRRLSREAENQLLTAETLSAVLGLYGRPYAQWDVYPTWELEEAWRELLQAQHHDNDECEGLCGHIGKFSYERSKSLSGHVLREAKKLLARRCGGDVCYNPLGWDREHRGVMVPAFGWAPAPETPATPMGWNKEGDNYIGYAGKTRVVVSPEGKIIEFGKPLAQPLLDFQIDGKTAFGCASLHWFDRLELEFDAPGGGRISARLHLGQDLEIRIQAKDLVRPEPGMQRGVTMPFSFGKPLRIIADQPLGMQEIRADGVGRKKYPTGDWMTSPQWFEEVHGGFTSSSFVDLLQDDDSGVLVLHEHTRQWFREGDTARLLLTMYDPWDEDYFVDTFCTRIRLVPHDPITNAERYRLSQEHSRPIELCMVAPESTSQPVVGILPSGEADARAGGFAVNPANVVATAFYREMESVGKEFEAYAAKGIGYPYVLRLLELDGVDSDVDLTLPATIAWAARTNLMGEAEGELMHDGSTVRLHMRAYEVTTIYLDLVEGRKQTRDLDAHRNVWATVHRE